MTRFTEKKICFQNGVHQGSLLVPFLFDLYFDQLLEELQKSIKLRRKNVEKDLVFSQLRWTKIFAYADYVAITTFGPQASWLVAEFIELAQNTILKSIFKKVDKKYDLYGIQKTTCYKYLGVLVSARGTIEHHRIMIKNRINYLCNQLSGLNKFLPIRHMTQLWNSYIKPHLDYVLMKYFSVTHLVQWQKLHRQSIKKVLKLSQFLSNEELDKICKQYCIRPNAILQSTAQQYARFCQQLKRTKGPFKKIQLQEMVKDLYFEKDCIMSARDEINQKINAMSENERMIKSNLKIKYIPSTGYQDRYKFSWRMCKCEERCNFNHLQYHNPYLKEEYELFEKELESYLLSGSQIYLLQFYQEYVCEQLSF